MSLEQLSKTVDFVQDVTPSNANDGETYLDTSQSPPRLKVFDSSVGSFIEPRSIQNLDAPVSGAGATQTDIESGAEGALEKDIVNLSPAGNSVAANLDGGVAAVDWKSKTPDSVFARGVTASPGFNTLVQVSGSGYVFDVGVTSDTDDSDAQIFFNIDGNKVDSETFGLSPSRGTAYRVHGDFTNTVRVEYSAIYRFESSFEIEVLPDVTNLDVSCEVQYVLD